jgi:thiol-disulfide isomerase/thioredoxin
MLSLLVVAAAFALPQSVKAENPSKVVITLFWGNGCPHCAVERPFLAKLQENTPIWKSAHMNSGTSSPIDQ